MATKAKDSSIAGKKKAPSSNSHTTITERTIKPSVTTTTNSTYKPNSTSLEKKIPNYLKPTKTSFLEPSHLNADPTTNIHVVQSQSNEISHDYHAQNGLPDEVVGDFSDDKDEILLYNNNINDNDDNDIYFLFQPTSIENVYHPYPNSADVGDNQVADNPNYRHFFGPTTTI